jgi:hypothetical protein
MAKYTVRSAIKKLKESPTNITCEEMSKILSDLGFNVKRGANGAHHTFSHPKIKTFFGSNYDCGHGAKMLPVYPKSVLRVLIELQDDLEGL